ncbi:MAG: DUF4430 domain-containing protein [Clostridia bacterium]|nr:DUF4430 domain-containing protein [Clostridia bacterium]
MKTKTRFSLPRALALAAFALLIAVLSFVYVTFREKAQAGSKNITLSVIDSAGKETIYTLSTDAQYLLGAMEEAEGLTFSGTEGPYGMMLTTVNGETADYNTNGAYWAVIVNGNYGNYGVSMQPVEDGDGFVILYDK